MNEPPRDLDAAAHPSGKVLHRLIFPLRQLDGFDQVGHQSLAALARNTVELGVNQKIFFDAQLHIARHRLRNDADQAPNGIGFLHHIMAANGGSARCRRKQRRQHPDERGLAGAVRSEQRKDLAVLDRKGNSVDRRKVPKAFRDLANFNIAHGKSFPALLHRQLDIRGHANGEAPIFIIDAQPDLECFDVPLCAAHIALRGEARIQSPVKNRAHAFITGRKPHFELIAQPDPVDVGFFNVGTHPKIVQIDQRHNRLPRVDDFPFARCTDIHDTVNRGPYLGVGKPDISTLPLRRRRFALPFGGTNAILLNPDMFGIRIGNRHCGTLYFDLLLSSLESRLGRIVCRPGLIELLNRGHPLSR